MADPHDKQYWQLLRTSSHASLARIWKAGQAGEDLPPEDELLYRIMLEHSEWHGIWDSLEYVAGKDIVIDGVSPILHVCMHSVVEMQYRQAMPPEVVEAIERLMRRGVSRHEAVHRVGELMGHHLWQCLRSQKPFDMEGYRRELRELR